MAILQRCSEVQVLHRIVNITTSSTSTVHIAVMICHFRYDSIISKTLGQVQMLSLQRHVEANADVSQTLELHRIDIIDNTGRGLEISSVIWWCR